MKFSLYVLLSAVCFSVSFSETSAQGTFTQIHQILQTSCAGSSCHQYGGNPSFDVTGSEASVYAQLVNAAPTNPAALGKGDKLVTPGYVERSFLLRKIAHGINDVTDYLALDQPSEGSPMPYGSSALKDYEIELIRQWILFGAPLTGTVVDTAIINKYYRGKGINDTYPTHTPPAPGTGFQMYLGKIFVPPSTELEYFIKHDPRIPQSVEVNNITTLMPNAAHHFVIFTFLPGQSGVHPEGIRPLSASSHGETGDGIGSGPGYREFQLPAGTAYFWQANAVLDLNLHIRNNNTDSVLGTDMYVNVYTQPLGTATEYMKVRNFPVFTISIPQDGQEHEFTEAAIDTNETKMWKIWMLYSHTHRYGTDYDIWLRNSDGSKGAQVYEGFYNQDYTFNQGFYAWGVDVAIKYFTPFLEVDPRLGFVHRAKYRNTNGPDPVNWGDTSLDEMMVVGFQYVDGDELTPLSSGNEMPDDFRLNVFPNPAYHAVSANYILQQRSNVTIQLTDVLGETVNLVDEKNKPAGNYLDEIDLKGFASGLYLLTFRSGDNTIVKKLMID